MSSWDNYPDHYLVKDEGDVMTEADIEEMLADDPDDEGLEED